MQRFRSLLFASSILLLSWLLLQAVHELGHVVGAVVTGGKIEEVILQPHRISRTEVSPNPHPAIVVWLGPVLGCLLPLGIIPFVPNQRGWLKNLAKFFAGFCLIANGAYISVGSWQGIGDSREMLRTGTPIWLLVMFGAVTIPVGLMLWHRLGSLKRYWDGGLEVDGAASLWAAGIAFLLVLVELAFALI